MEHIDLDFLGRVKEIDTRFNKLYEKITGLILQRKIYLNNQNNSLENEELATLLLVDLREVKVINFWFFNTNSI